MLEDKVMEGVDWDELSQLTAEAEVMVEVGHQLLSMHPSLLQSVQLLNFFVSPEGQEEYLPKYAGQVRQALNHVRKVDEADAAQYERALKSASPSGFHGKSSVSHRKVRV